MMKMMMKTTMMRMSKLRKKDKVSAIESEGGGGCRGVG